jgi:hypothetical protein
MGIFIAYLFGVLTGIKKQNQKNAAHDSNSAAERSDCPSQPIIAEVRFPEAVERERRANQEKQHSLQKQLVIATWFTFVAVFIYAGITLGLWYETNRNAKIASQQLEMSERPWISAKLAFTGPPSPFHKPVGLTFNKDGSATLAAFVVFKNIGHTIATDIYDDTATLLPFSKSADFAKEMKKRNDRCDNIRQVDLRGMSLRGPALFPGEEGSHRIEVPISKADIDTVTNTPTPSKVRVISILIHGCVSYESSINNTIHQTRFLYILMPVGFGSGTLPPSKLQLIEYPFNSKDAD